MTEISQPSSYPLTDRLDEAILVSAAPSQEQVAKELRIKAYPTREYGEIVWAYMGPDPWGEKIPEVPMLEFGQLPPSHRYVTKKRQECNWAQAIEGALDTSHFSFLHMPAPSVPSNENPDAPADEKRLAWIRKDPMPQFSILEHDVGFVVGGARRADGRNIYWRTTQFALPSHSTTPSTGQLPATPRRPARPRPWATPTALGRWEAMVLVWGGTLRALEPSTLWRPPDIGSSREATRLSSRSHRGRWPGR